MHQHIYVMRVEGAVSCSGLLPDDDPYGSKHVGVKSATKVTACDNILIIYIWVHKLVKN